MGKTSKRPVTLTREQFNRKFQREKRRGLTDEKGGIRRKIKNINDHYDPDIRPHLLAIDRLPFALTTWSCSGHLNTWERRYVAPAIRGNLDIGRLGIMFNHSVQAEALREKIRKLAADNPRIQIREVRHPLDYLPHGGDNSDRFWNIVFHTETGGRDNSHSFPPVEEAKRIHAEQVQARDSLLRILEETENHQPIATHDGLYAGIRKWVRGLFEP